MIKLDPRDRARRLRTLLYEQMVQGSTPRGLALTCSTGVVMGCMPLLGITTLLLLLIGHIFKLNQPILQAVNYAMTPIHLLMLPVFFVMGHLLFDVPTPPLDPNVFWERLMLTPHLFLSRFGISLASAIAVWLLVSPIIFGIIYFLTYRFFHALKNRSST